MADPRTLLLAQSGDPRAQLDISGRKAQMVGQSVPDISSSQTFGLALMNLLHQYQQLGTKPFAEQELGAREEQARRVFQTPENLIGASPQIQASVREAAQQAIQPTITGAQKSAQTFTEQLKGFGDTLEQAKAIGNFMQEEENKRKKNELDFIFNFPSAIKNLPEEQKRELEKRQGFVKGFLDQIPDISKGEETPDIKEYKFAKSQGYGGQFTDFLIQMKRKQSELGIPLPISTIPVISPLTNRAENVLEGVDAGTAQIVKNLVDYKIPLPSGFALRSPYWQKILSLASLYDSSFDATQYNVRLKLKQDFTSGKSAQNIRSLNTVIGHLDTLQDKATSLNNSSFQLWNNIKNRGLTAIGDKRVVEFQNAANAVSNELSNVFKGTGATDQEIKSWRENLNQIQSPQQLAGALNTALELTSSRAEALRGQYEAGLGRPKDFHFLNNRSRAILTKLGQSPDIWDPVNNVIEKGERKFKVIQ